MAIFNSYVKLPEGSTGWCRLILPLCEKYKDDQKKQKKHHHHLHARYFLIFLKKIKMALSFIDPSLWGLKFAHTHIHEHWIGGIKHVQMTNWIVSRYSNPSYHIESYWIILGQGFEAPMPSRGLIGGDWPQLPKSCRALPRYGQIVAKACVAYVP